MGETSVQQRRVRREKSFKKSKLKEKSLERVIDLGERLSQGRGERQRGFLPAGLYRAVEKQSDKKTQ